MAQNDVWRFSCLGSHAGTEIAVITLHARETSGIAEVSSFASGVTTLLLTNFAALQANTFRWDQINALTVNTNPKRSQEYVSGFPLAGQQANNVELPHQVAQVVTHKTQYAGRSYRGRCFVPAMVETFSQDGLFTTAFVSQMQTYWDAFLAVYGSSGSDTNWRWVVWSQKLNSANNVTQAIVRNNPGIIRRRRVGVGQ